MTELEAMTSWISGAPIRAGEASPLRVATGGNANWSSKSVAAARPPAQINGAITRGVCREKKTNWTKINNQNTRFTLEPN